MLAKLRVATCLSVIFVAAQVISLPAEAYDSADTYELSLPDTLGTGTATADASADRQTGALSLAVSATSNAPAGAVIADLYGQRAAAGGSYAKAHGRMIQTLSVPAGTRTLRVVYSSVNAAIAKGTQGVNVYGYGQYSNAYAEAKVYGVYYPCASGNCSGVQYPAATTYLNNGSNGTITLTATFQATASGRVIVSTYLSGQVVSSGPNGSASITASATVTEISLT